MTTYQLPTRQPDALNVTRANQWRRCPQQWAYHYSDVEPLDDDPDFFKRGRAVHASLEVAHDFLRDIARGPNPYPDLMDGWTRRRALDELFDRWHREGLPDGDDYQNAAAAIEAKLNDDYLFQRVTRKDILWVEKRFEIIVEAPPDRIAANGAIDLALLDPGTHHVETVDYKTGTDLSTPASPKHRHQFGLYALAAYELIPDLETVTATLSYPERQTLGDNHQSTMSASVTPQWMADTTNWIAQTAAEQEHAAANTHYPITPGGHCDWCPYRRTCPAGTGQVEA